MVTMKATWAALAAACLVAACGGGSDRDDVSSVTVVGDSLSDSGTFGYKFTVQGAAPTGPSSSQIWTERIAGSYGTTLCPRYSSTGASYSINTSCSNYAVGGARINNTSAPAAPTSVLQQLQDVGNAGYDRGNLLLADGGANDAADLIGAYLKVSSDGGVAYVALLRTVLDTATVNAAVAGGAAGLAGAGNAYMKALAARFEGSLRVNTLAKGAPRVVVLNIPDITITPRFRMVLASVSASNGAAAAAQLQAQFRGWVQAFNSELASRFANEGRVAVVDFYTRIQDNVARPATYGLTNATDAACPATGVGSDGLPSYTFTSCTEAALTARTPPAGATGGSNWWKTYIFSDSFHPTPYGHQLMANLVADALERSGWR